MKSNGKKWRNEIKMRRATHQTSKVVVLFGHAINTVENVN